MSSRARRPKRSTNSKYVLLVGYPARLILTASKTPCTKHIKSCKYLSRKLIEFTEASNYKNGLRKEEQTMKCHLHHTAVDAIHSGSRRFEDD
jgi:hypothetical protein